MRMIISHLWLEKCHVLLNSQGPNTIKIGNLCIKSSSCEKMLDINFDYTLKFTNHIDEICKKVPRVLNFLALRFGNLYRWNERTRKSMGIQKINEAVETYILPLQTMQTILLQDWFSLIRFYVLSTIFCCGTKNLVLFIIFFLKI